MLSSIGAIVDAMKAVRPLDRPLIIGIAGSPGAGKSTIAEQLHEALECSAILPMDGFHLSGETLIERGSRDRMGAPDTFDVASFVRCLIELRDGHDGVLAPGFDRDTEEPIPEAILISPSTRIVIVEGNYLLFDGYGWGEVASLLDLTFFVDVDPDTRRERLIARHEQFGKSAADARAWALGPDESNAIAIESTAVRADHRIALG
ncbi:MAG: AAA family ATPase [Microbacteriaceae bacterium]